MGINDVQVLLMLLSDNFLEETRPYHFFSYASLGKMFTETVYREESKPAQNNRFLFEVLNTFTTVTSNS